MRIPSLPRRYAVGLGVLACALFAGLLIAYPAPVAPPAKTVASQALVLSWVDHGDKLQIAGDGYRANGVVEIRLGSEPIQRSRAGKTGQVLVNVPGRLIALGQPGASVIVIGRSRIGTSRTLVSAVPPQGAGRGPIDALPWAVGALVVARIGLGVLRRRRRAAKDPDTPPVPSTTPAPPEPTGNTAQPGPAASTAALSSGAAHSE